jgi:hypothetical protein
VAELRASTNVHTDQLLMRHFNMLSIMLASNSRLEFGWDEDYAWVTERLGLLGTDAGQEPERFGTGSYETEGEIEGVLHRFEETDYNAVPTATPAR